MCVSNVLALSDGVTAGQRREEEEEEERRTNGAELMGVKKALALVR